jgi:hypothetical protein
MSKTLDPNLQSCNHLIELSVLEQSQVNGGMIPISIGIGIEKRDFKTEIKLDESLRLQISGNGNVVGAPGVSSPV